MLDPRTDLGLEGTVLSVIQDGFGWSQIVVGSAEYELAIRE